MPFVYVSHVRRQALYWGHLRMWAHGNLPPTIAKAVRRTAITLNGFLLKITKTWGKSRQILDRVSRQGFSIMSDIIIDRIEPSPILATWSSSHASRCLISTTVFGKMRLQRCQMIYLHVISLLFSIEWSKYKISSRYSAISNFEFNKLNSGIVTIVIYWAKQPA